jgi:membrane protease YdiL (CAAX protease family)
VHAAPPAPPAPRPALWPVFAAYGAAFFLVLIGSALYLLVPAVWRVGWNPVRVADEAASFAFTRAGLLGAALVSALVLMAVTLVTARLLGGGVASRLATAPTRARPAGIAAAVVGLAGLSLACGSAAQLAGVGKTGVTESIAQALRSSSPVSIVLAVLCIGVAPAFAEEGFFRGLMQTRLRARWSRWPAILVTALAFGAFHVDPVQGTEAFVAGIFFGWVVDRFGGIRPSIAAHAFNNAMFVLFASLAGSDDDGARSVTAGILAGGLAAFAAATAVIRSRHAVRSD